MYLVILRCHQCLVRPTQLEKEDLPFYVVSRSNSCEAVEAMITSDRSKSFINFFLTVQLYVSAKLDCEVEKRRRTEPHHGDDLGCKRLFVPGIYQHLFEPPARLYRQTRGRTSNSFLQTIQTPRLLSKCQWERRERLYWLRDLLAYP